MFATQLSAECLSDVEFHVLLNLHSVVYKLFVCARVTAVVFDNFILAVVCLFSTQYV